MDTQERMKVMKKKRQTYLGMYQNGELGVAAQIHVWHDEQNLTVEYLQYFDMLSFVAMGHVPSFEPINVESTCDICLNDLPQPYDSYKLHYTYMTIAGDFVKAERARDRRKRFGKDATR